MEAKYLMSVNETRELDANMFKNEVCFVGRSNVGKSSIINAVTGIKNLCFTSKKPGKTVSINFFDVKYKVSKFTMVDLPGYGYAKQDNETMLNWRRLMNKYFKMERDVKCIYMLIDSRRGITDVDKEAMDFLLATGNTCSIIMTKSDKLKKDELDIIYKEVKSGFEGVCKGIYLTSAKERIGVDDLRRSITEVLS
jgi:GTP-binding protein